MREFGETLRRALTGTQAEALPSETISRLETLDRILVRWSESIDLIGFRSDEERIQRYFAEPLAALPWVPREGKALDIGSGGGSPGLPLAIARPGLEWTLLEPRRKRSLFLEEAIGELGIGNAVVERARLEDRSVGTPVDLVTVRGVRLTEADVGDIAGILERGGRFLWFGKEARLREVVEPLRRRARIGVSGPFALLMPASASVLVVTREA